MSQSPLLRITMVCFAFVVLLNLQTISRLKFSKTPSENTVIDPSGYYDLTHPDAGKAADKEEDKSSVFYLNFFGFPAILLCLGIWYGFKKSGTAVSLIKLLAFFILSWIVYEIIAYTMLAASVASFGLAVFLLPLFGLASQLIFVKFVSMIFNYQFKRNSWLYAFFTLLILLVPVTLFYFNFQTEVLVSIAIICWQGIFVLALYGTEKKLHVPQVAAID